MTMTTPTSLWQHVPLAKPDALFDLNRRYKEDPDPNKVGLGVGAYRDNDGQPYVMNVVREAELELLRRDKAQGYPGSYEYPPEGDGEFLRLALGLLYGADQQHRSTPIAACQSISGTGALRLAADLLALRSSSSSSSSTTSSSSSSNNNKAYAPAVYFSNPTWPNHPNIFVAAGFHDIRYYKYWNMDVYDVDWTGMKEDFASAPEGSILVLHLCSHNPTGADLTKSQWMELAGVIQPKRHVCVFDCAYQGYATGDLENDAFPVRYFVDQGISCVCCQSFAKNFGLYGERVGVVSVVCTTAETATKVQAHLRHFATAAYGSPIDHGAKIVQLILSEPKRRKHWEEELRIMSDRIKRMRTVLYEKLTQDLRTPGRWEHFIRQIGMFSYTGMTEYQCEELIRRHHVYSFPKDGRISIAGLTDRNCGRVANAIHQVITKP